jgi:hypothetical protein
MTGKEIAKVLRKTRKKWGRKRLYNPEHNTYCVLGVLASRRGASKRVLAALDQRWDINFDDSLGLHDLIDLNDTSAFKEQVISALETKFKDKRWPIGRFMKEIRKRANNPGLAKEKPSQECQHDSQRRFVARHSATGAQKGVKFQWSKT